MSGGLELYLCEKESEVDNYVRELDITIATKPVGDLTRETLKLTDDEVLRLREMDKVHLLKHLFSKFGIYDLESKIGLPKGPYYWVDESVYIALGITAK